MTPGTAPTRRTPPGAPPAPAVVPAVALAVIATVIAALLGGAPAARAVPSAPHAPAAAQWSAAPAGGGGRAYFYLEGRPGAVLKDTLSISNPTARPRTLRLRGAAAGTGTAGSPAPWMAFAVRRVTVPPRTRADVPFTVTVPLDAALGDHPGTVRVTGGGREERLDVRLRVSGRPLAALSVEDMRVVAHRDGGAVIHYVLVNRGNTTLAPRLEVRAEGLFGEVLHRGSRPLPVTLRPGKRLPLTERWRDAPGLDAVDVTLTATADGGARSSATAAYTAVPGWAWALGAALAAVTAGACGVGLRRWRRARRRRRGRGGPGGRPGIRMRWSGTARARRRPRAASAARTARAAVLLPAVLGLVVVCGAGGTPAVVRDRVEDLAGSRIDHARTGWDRADREPSVTLDPAKAGKGGTITVRGTGWRPGALLTLLICGQNMIGGTNSCANAAGRAVTADAVGSFSRRLPVVGPPKPCPCVVHVATVTGEPAAADAALTLRGHRVAPLPRDTGGERLSVLSARLDGTSTPLTWFGAPARRKLVLTIGNLGSAPARDPVFEVGTSHGVLAPEWAEQQWRGTIPAGRKTQVTLDVELPAGAHGDYLVSLRYGKRTLVEQPWSVGRPWGVTLFWVLLCLVIPAGVFRVGMAVVDRIRPRTAPTDPGEPAASTSRRDAAASTSRREPAAPARPAREAKSAAPSSHPAALPWFAPDTQPRPDRGRRARSGRTEDPHRPTTEPPGRGSA